MRNQYGSLPLHMAASNQASAEVVRLLIDSYPDALHLQNDDGMTPLDLALADESANETVVAMLEGRPPPPEMSQRQKAEKLGERAIALERKLTSLREASTRQAQDLSDAVAAVRRLADRFPHALYAAGVDPNELEIALSSSITDEAGLSGRVGGKKGQTEAEAIILDAVKRRTASVVRDSKGERMAETSVGVSSGPRDRVEDLLSSIVGLDHIKSQVRLILVRCSSFRDKRIHVPAETIPSLSLISSFFFYPACIRFEDYAALLKSVISARAFFLMLYKAGVV